MLLGHMMSRCLGRRALHSSSPLQVAAHLSSGAPARPCELSNSVRPDSRPVQFRELHPKLEARSKYISCDEYARTLFVTDLPQFAIMDDVETLFEESGFPV
jgi:hypothetical protein